MITREMTIGDIMQSYPQTIPVLKSFGLDCRECQIADYEDLNHGASVHEVDVDRLLLALNEVIKS